MRYQPLYKCPLCGAEIRKGEITIHVMGREYHFNCGVKEEQQYMRIENYGGKGHGRSKETMPLLRQVG